MKTAQITYTKDSKNGDPKRMSKEVAIEKVERTIEKLTEQNAYQFDVVYSA